MICGQTVINNWPMCWHWVFPSYTEIAQNIVNRQKPADRTTLEGSEDIHEDVIQMMLKCWSEDPNERPDFQSLRPIIRKMNK